MKEPNEPKSIDFRVLGEPLITLLTATGHKLAREWPAKYKNVTGARELLVLHLRAAQVTFRATLYMCGDVPPDPRRSPEFCIALPVLNRGLLDSLFAILFILEDVRGRCELFWEADWRETRLELDRYTAEFGHLPEWQSWLAELTKHCDAGMAHAKLTSAQASNPKSLRSWPNSGAMLNFGVSPNAPTPPVRAFMKYLNDYFYIDLSQQSHLGGWGLIKRTGFLLDEVRNLQETEALLKRNRYAHIGQTVGLVLALASEIEAHFNFGLRQDTLFVWGVAAPSIVVVDELYRKRYRDLLCV
jgi:hypothetical protein